MAIFGRYSRRLTAVLGLLILWARVAAASPLDLPNPAWTTPAPPNVSAGAAILMDWRTGQVLMAKNADQARDPASTTKILTAFVAVERGNMSDKVTVSRRAAFTAGSSMHIKQGEVYSLHDLLHGLLLRSGNDAAVAIAEHIAGSVEAFAQLMNDKAHSVGAVHSHFMNPHGLTEPQHFTTARDLALITRYALQHPVVANIVALKQRPLTYEFLNRDVILYNTNRLLSTMEGADGVKTGTTAAAGACLIASATRDDQKLLAVVLNAGNRWRDAQSLLEWGFGNFRLDFLGHQGETLVAVPVTGGRERAVPVALSRDLAAVSPRSGNQGPRLEATVAASVAAPVSQGKRLGKAVVKTGDLVVAEADLLAVRDVPKASWFERIYRKLRPLVTRTGDERIGG